MCKAGIIEIETKHKCEQPTESTQEELYSTTFIPTLKTSTSKTTKKSVNNTDTLTSHVTKIDARTHPKIAPRMFFETSTYKSKYLS
jgi:uncharacterized protein Veg